MKVSEFNYELPERLIAQVPIEKRDESRLMVLNREEKNFKYEIGSYFYSENSKAYKEVKLYFNHNFNNGEIINLNFKTPKTTIMKELKNKIKKGMG